MIRFLHASDLHLGKPFGSYPEDVRARLRLARHDSLAALAQAARLGGASHILLAGDTFDAETPSPATIRHALNSMADDPALTWVMMPGNHDSLAAAELWRILQRDRPANVVLATQATPVDLGPAILLPAPCTVRQPGRDLTEWMDAAETPGRIRIGLAHGGIRDFSSLQDRADEVPSPVIAPDRAERAGLDYLGLGDWHGRIEVGPRTWYSGTPEADSFKPHRPAGAVLVSITAPGVPAEITEVETGAIEWQRHSLAVYSGDNDPVSGLGSLLPEVAQRSRTLFGLTVSGRLTLSDRRALDIAVRRLAPDFLWHFCDTSQLVTVPQTDDLDLIAGAGALRQAAEILSGEAGQEGDSQTRQAAQAALERLFSYALEDE